MEKVIVNLRTGGSPISVAYSRLRTHSTQGWEMASLDLEIGGHEVAIRFETWQEMIDFCTAHNFPFDDKRDAR